MAFETCYTIYKVQKFQSPQRKCRSSGREANIILATQERIFPKSYSAEKNAISPMLAMLHAASGFRDKPYRHIITSLFSQQVETIRLPL